METRQFLTQLLITNIVAVGIAYFSLRFFFKGSLLFRLGALWVLNAILVGLNNKIGDFYPAYANPFISFPIVATVTVFLLSLASKQVRKPLSESIKNVNLMSKGNLAFEVDRTFMDRNDDLG